jgi:tRNA threonylcarbamoyladenosine biosynthesis protein TsaE
MSSGAGPRRIGPSGRDAERESHVDPSELIAHGEKLGRSLPPRAIVTFEGDLGAGKTTLAQAIARGLGVAAPATSPTYALVHRYQGRRGPVFHVDCYRLRSA